MRYNAGMSTAAHLMTADDLFRLPEDESRWCELIEGEIVRGSIPVFAHSVVAQQASNLLYKFANRMGLGEVIGAKVGYLISRNPDTVLAPDGAFVRKERFVVIGAPDGYFPEAPAFIFEVISPTDRMSEVSVKMRHWLQGGVELAWVIDLAARTVAVYQAVDDIQILSEKDAVTGGNVLPGFECRVADLFAGL